jgi:methylthioribose-1-phosphate isomerase
MDAGGALPRPWLLRALDLETSQADTAQVYRDTLQALRDALEEAWLPTADTGEVRSQLEAYVGRLRRARPGDASLNAALDRAVAALPLGRERAVSELEAIQREGEEAGGALIAAAESLFAPGSRVLTLGYSELIQHLLTRYSDRLEGVTVSEGRPRGEGARLAAAVGKQAIPVRLITEAQLDLFIPECDLIVVAAERVLPDGDVVAPAGTAVAARLCAVHDVPFYVAAESRRWVPAENALAHFGRERRPPSEVLPNPPEGVQVANIAYDLTPSELIAAYVTECGLTTPQRKDAALRAAA